MSAWYNENDHRIAVWLQDVLPQGCAPGVVDTRSVVDVPASELEGYTQWHLFAGIGGWSLALRMAGIPDDFPVLTGSCPCQPFSAAGKLKGFDDERHLWPEMFRIIKHIRPSVCFGEQVAGAPGRAWLATVRSDLRQQAMPSGPPICALRASARPTPASDSSGEQFGWVTPTSRDWKDSVGMSFESTDPCGKRRVREDLLPRQVFLCVVWSPPTAMDSRRGVLPARPQDTGEPLTQQVGDSIQDKTLVFLRGLIPTGSVTERAAGGQLNPEHSRWLMGYPAGWYNSTGTATLLSLKSRRRSSRVSSKQQGVSGE